MIFSKSYLYKAYFNIRIFPEIFKSLTYINFVVLCRNYTGLEYFYTLC